MAKNSDDKKVIKLRGDGAIDDKKLKGFVSEAEDAQAEIDDIMAKARKECQPHRDQIKDIKTAAAEEGFPKREFAAVLSHRRKKMQADQVRSKLHEDQVDNYDNMLHALGDLAETPLGQAAMAAAE